jgi:hypothetical protein
MKPLVLCQDRDLVGMLETQDTLAARLAQSGRTEHQGIQILLRSSAIYQPDRVVYECLAYRSGETKHTG